MKIKEKINCIIKPIQVHFLEKEPKNKIFEDIDNVKKEIEYSRNLFNSLENTDLIESCIYQIGSLEVKYNYLLKKAKSLGISYSELKDPELILTNNSKEI